MSLKKEDFTSFDLQTLEGASLFSTNSDYDFPEMYDRDGNQMENVLVIKGRNLPDIDRGKYIYVIATKKSGTRLKFKTAVSLSARFQINIKLDPDKAELMEERRRFFKIKTNEKAYITFVLHEDENTIQLEPPAEILVKDMNVGGAFFVCINPATQFLQSDKVMIVLALAGEKLELMSEVLRVQPINDESGCGYGCRFIDMNGRQEELISRYIYKLQYEMLQKERSLRD